nr:MAG TPA: Kruppel-like factor 3 finger, kruppel-like, DNA BINDING [Caudoviricetes sp.]
MYNLLVQGDYLRRLPCSICNSRFHAPFPSFRYVLYSFYRLPLEPSI